MCGTKSAVYESLFDAVMSTLRPQFSFPYLTRCTVYSRVMHVEYSHVVSNSDLGIVMNSAPASPAVKRWKEKTRSSLALDVLLRHAPWIQSKGKTYLHSPISQSAKHPSMIRAAQVTVTLSIHCGPYISGTRVWFPAVDGKRVSLSLKCAKNPLIQLS